ncbi:MAG TPA: hypothetical protein DD384_01770 [Firmicutes bacterium]|nr:hypothetical protein [Bacillota bacterium]
MEWWVILLIVLGSILAFILLLFIVLFIVYMFNLDSKLLVHVQKWINKKYDKRKRNRHLE